MGRESPEDGMVRTIVVLRIFITHTNMKKSELSQITQLIELIVAKEVRKQLPTIIAETFQNMMGKSVVTEAQKPVAQPPQRKSIEENIETVEDEDQDEQVNLKASLRELFAGTPVMQSQPQTRQPKQFTKNPVLNQILNETVPDLRSREGLAGMAAIQGGYNPAAISMAAPMMPMEEGPEPAFMRNVPSMGMPRHVHPAPQMHVPSIPVGKPPVLIEGQESSHAPLSALPDGVSALDVARHGAAPATVTNALTRNYSQMLKLIDKKKGKVA